MVFNAIYFMSIWFCIGGIVFIFWGAFNWLNFRKGSLKDDMDGSALNYESRANVRIKWGLIFFIIGFIIFLVYTLFIENGHISGKVSIWRNPNVEISDGKVQVRTMK